MRAVTAVFTPTEQVRRERLKMVERMAHEVRLHIRSGMAPRAVILVTGSKLVIAMPRTPNYQRLLALKSALLVGIYDGDSDPERVKCDLEATLTDYFEGQPTITHSKGNGR